MKSGIIIEPRGHAVRPCDEEGTHARVQDIVTREPRDRVRVPGLWTVFVLGWLVVVAVAIARVNERSRGSAVTMLALIGAFVLLYLWIAQREALCPEDFTQEGPGAVRLRRRLAWLGALLALVVSLVWLVPGGSFWWFAQHVIVVTCLALPPSLAVPITAVLVLGSFWTGWHHTGRLDWMLLVQAAFGAAAIAIRQLTINVAQLRAAREELARLAVAEERLRFGRDLHDLLGHTLSVITLKSELAGRLLPAAPERAREELQDIENAAREALRQVRETVAGYVASYRQPQLASELEAASQLLVAAGIEATIELQSGELASPLDGLLAWAVREGVNNVIRHSGARHCEVCVRVHDGRAEVEVRDDGRARAGTSAPLGNGLHGLTERAAVLGGRLQARARSEGGFALTVDAPLHDGAQTGGAR